MTTQSTVQTNQRFIAKFNNGFHKVFDTVTYSDAYLHYLRKEAVEHVTYLNQAAGSNQKRK